MCMCVAGTVDDAGVLACVCVVFAIAYLCTCPAASYRCTCPAASYRCTCPAASSRRIVTCRVFVGVAAAAAAPVAVPAACGFGCMLDGVPALLNAPKRAVRPLAVMGVGGTRALGTVLTAPGIAGCVPGVARLVDVDAVWCVSVVFDTDGTRTAWHVPSGMPLSTACQRARDANDHGMPSAPRSRRCRCPGDAYRQFRVRLP